MAAPNTNRYAKRICFSDVPPSVSLDSCGSSFTGAYFVKLLEEVQPQDHVAADAVLKQPT